jgi:membrane peptidoglycan carboxypeptidase
VSILRRYLTLVLLAAGGLVAATLVLAPMTRALATAGHSTGKSEIVTLSDLAERSVVYARDGSVLDVFHAEQNRSPVTFNEVPRTVINAVVDTEDDRFWDHKGVNPQATLRALVTNVNRGSVVQGGSTITQQLVKNTLLTSEKSVGRKFKEAVLAVRLEQELTKQQILERYLNTVYFGNGAYGLGAAAGIYFGEGVSQLTTVQGAFLAGLIRNPDGYDPFRFATRSKARRAFVLDRMVARHDLSPVDALFLKATPMPVVKVVEHRPDNIDSYFIEEVKQRLLNDPDLGGTAQARYNAVFRGGLQIYTTLDRNMQAAAKQAVADYLPTEGGKWTAALVAVDPSNGAVRALIGGPGFDQSQYRIATQGTGRQPGSSFKPIVLAAALNNNYSVWAGVDGSSPCSFRTGPTTYTKPINNNEGEQVGYTSLTNAMALSVNCAYARTGIAVGLPKVVDMAKGLGIETPMSPLVSMSIGTEEVRPVDMAGAYATFANDGVHHRPYLVDRVVDRNGKLIFTGGDKGTPVMSPEKAREETQVLRSVVQYGTGTAAALSDRAVAGKTGTSDNNANAWFDGYTPQLTTVVWMGSPLGNVPMRSVGGKTASGASMYYRTVFGGTYPALIWHDFMQAALKDQPVLGFVPPDPRQFGVISYVPNPVGSYTGSSGYSPAPRRRSHSTTTLPGGPATTVTGGAPTTISTPGPPTTEVGGGRPPGRPPPTLLGKVP